MVVEHNKKQAQTDGKVHTEYIFVQKKVPFMVLGIVDICFFFLQIRCAMDSYGL